MYTGCVLGVPVPVTVSVITATVMTVSVPILDVYCVCHVCTVCISSGAYGAQLPAESADHHQRRPHVSMSVTPAGAAGSSLQQQLPCQPYRPHRGSCG
jgi:hypothetical protein